MLTRRTTWIAVLALSLALLITAMLLPRHLLLFGYDKDHPYESSGVDGVYSWTQVRAEAADGECRILPGTTEGIAYPSQTGDIRQDLINLVLIIPSGAADCQFGVKQLTGSGTPQLGSSRYEAVSNDDWRAGLQGMPIETLNVSLPPGEYAITRNGESTDHLIVVD